MAQTASPRETTRPQHCREPRSSRYFLRSARRQPAQQFRLTSAALPASLRAAGGAGAAVVLASYAGDGGEPPIIPPDSPPATVTNRLMPDGSVRTVRDGDPNDPLDAGAEEYYRKNTVASSGPHAAARATPVQDNHISPPRPAPTPGYWNDVGETHDGLLLGRACWRNLGPVWDVPSSDPNRLGTVHGCNKSARYVQRDQGRYRQEVEDFAGTGADCFRRNHRASARRHRGQGENAQYLRFAKEVREAAIANDLNETIRLQALADAAKADAAKLGKIAEEEAKPVEAAEKVRKAAEIEFIRPANAEDVHMVEGQVTCKTPTPRSSEGSNSRIRAR